MNEEYNLRPVWDAMLEIYDAILQVCKKEGISFFATGGTLLGAVRHGGFIPWDDDMDFLFRLDQYERFLRVAPSMLPPYFKIVTFGKDTNFPFLFAKIQDVRKDKLEAVRMMSRLPLSEGLFVDIFPYSGIPRHGYLQSAKQMALRLLRCALQTGDHISMKSKIGWFLGQLVRPFFPRMRNIWDALECQWERIHKIPCDTSERLGFYNCDLCKHTYCCDAAWYRETKWLKFDCVEVPVPIDYDKMLRVHYGDYMKLPPVEAQRITHVNVPDAIWKIDESGS